MQIRNEVDATGTRVENKSGEKYERTYFSYETDKI